LQALEFWKAVTVDQANFLESLISLLAEHQIRYCVVGGQAVNAYVEPLVSLDFDLVIAAGRLEETLLILSGEFKIDRFSHTVNLSHPGSDLRIQIQTDDRYSEFVDRSIEKTVLGISLPVADLSDILQSKVWAAMDANRRGSKRQKDLADIGRILEAYPDLRPAVPDELLSRLF